MCVCESRVCDLNESNTPIFGSIASLYISWHIVWCGMEHCFTLYQRHCDIYMCIFAPPSWGTTFMFSASCRHLLLLLHHLLPIEIARAVMYMFCVQGAHIYIYIYVCVHMDIHIHICKCIYVYMFACIYKFLQICIFMYMYINVYTQIYVYIWVNV